MCRNDRISIEGLNDRESQHLRRLSANPVDGLEIFYVDYDGKLTNTTQKKLDRLGIQVITTDRYKVLTRQHDKA